MALDTQAKPARVALDTFELSVTVLRKPEHRSIHALCIAHRQP